MHSLRFLNVNNTLVYSKKKKKDASTEVFKKSCANNVLLTNNKCR